MINNLLLDNKKYGLIKNSTYFYNLDDKRSLTHIAWKKNERYHYHIKNNLIAIINKSLEKYNIVIKYVQYLVVIHYLQFLLMHNFKKIDVNYIINDNEFLKLSTHLFKYIDKEIIDNLDIAKRYKYFFYNLKGINTYSYLEDTKVLIHNFNVFTRKITFSFSEDSNYISDNFEVYIKRKKGIELTKLIKKEKKDLLHYLSSDFSRNLFCTKLSPIGFFVNNTFIIKDIKNNFSITVVSNSLFKRILTKFSYLSERII